MSASAVHQCLIAALRACGIAAHVEQTGGGVECVVIPVPTTACQIAARYDADGDGTDGDGWSVAIEGGGVPQELGDEGRRTLRELLVAGVRGAIAMRRAQRLLN